MTNQILKSLLTIVCMSLTIFGARAQTYPSRPITIIVPFPAGNSSDLAMRLIARQIEPSLGQPVVVDNRAGAGGSIGAAFAARRPADGYTLIMGSPGPMAISPVLRQGLTYDPLMSFDPVAAVAFLPQVFVVSANSPTKDLKSLLSAAKDNPGKLNYASSGVGSTQHLLGAQLAASAKVSMTHVPYQGNAAAMQDLLAGRVDVMSDVLSTVLPMIKSGKLVPIAVSTSQRLTALPNVPTVIEQGVEGFDIQSWIMIYGPAGMPDDIARRLNKEIGKALESSELKKVFLDQSMLPMPVAYENLKPFMAKEVSTWRRLVEVSGAKIE